MKWKTYRCVVCLITATKLIYYLLISSIEYLTYFCTRWIRSIMMIFVGNIAEE